MVNSLKALWNGVSNITVQTEVTDPVTKRTSFEPVELVTDEPCRLSFKNIANAVETATGNKVSQVVKLFLSPEINVPAGAKITVTQNGRTTAYKNSGEPAVYSSHQEIILELFKGWT
ncbi:MAG: hypothetical protein Q8865_04040 [Bacillota bacterium]|nr:hypothetical protein [Bacillota bacterium]